MTVAASYEPVLVTGDGSTQEFDFGFFIFATSDLVVNLIDPDTLVATLQTLGVDYTATIDPAAPGGTVTFVTAPADGTLVSIMRSIPVTQSADIPAGGLFREKQIENALDRAILIIQQLAEQMARAVLRDVTQSGRITLPAPVADGYIKYNDAADGLETSDAVVTTLSEYNGTVTHGTAASKAASPEQGDLHFATDTGAIYGCKVNGAWALLNDIPAAASESAAGIVELATLAEVNAGSDTGRAVTPDTLSASKFGRKTLIVNVVDPADTLATGDGKKYFPIPEDLNGMNLVGVAANVYTASTSGAVTVTIERGRRSAANGVLSYVDVLSTALTIDQDEFDTKNAATPAAINTSNDDVVNSTYVDMYRVNIDGAGVSAQGLDLRLIFAMP